MQKKIKIIEVKKAIENELSLFFSQRGYNLKKNKSTFFKINNGIKYSFFIAITSRDNDISIDFFATIHFNDVEKTISAIINDGYSEDTIGSDIKSIFLFNNMLEQTENKFHFLINDFSDLTNLTILAKKYFEEIAEVFFKKFNSLSDLQFFLKNQQIEENTLTFGTANKIYKDIVCSKLLGSDFRQIAKIYLEYLGKFDYKHYRTIENNVKKFLETFTP
jgi:hypothetical protein